MLNMSFVEPLDERRRPAARRARRGGIVTAEEATITGGLGAAVAEPSSPSTTRSRCASWACRGFAPTGSTAFLLDHFGLTADGIAAAARELLGHDALRPLVLAIDQGTSSTKALLVDAAGAIVARGSGAGGDRHPRPGWVEQDADEIWDSVRRGGRAPA